jgi:hypothetical protein
VRSARPPQKKIAAATNRGAKSDDAIARSKYLDDLILTPTQRKEPTPGYGTHARWGEGR